MAVERIVDHSVVLDEGTQTYPGDPEPMISVAARIESEGFFPSWIRSRRESPMPWYFRATETTSRRLAMMNRCRARPACRIASRARRMLR